MTFSDECITKCAVIRPYVLPPTRAAFLPPANFYCNSFGSGFVECEVVSQHGPILIQRAIPSVLIDLAIPAVASNHSGPSPRPASESVLDLAACSLACSAENDVSSSTLSGKKYTDSGRLDASDRCSPSTTVHDGTFGDHDGI